MLGRTVFDTRTILFKYCGTAHVLNLAVLVAIPVAVLISFTVLFVILSLQHTIEGLLLTVGISDQDYSYG